MDYEKELEKISDELQQQQLAYIDAEILTADEDKDEEYHNWMQKQLKLIKELSMMFDVFESKGSEINLAR